MMQSNNSIPGRGMFLSRRAALAAAGATTLITATRCASISLPPQVAVAHAVDAHCHVFTGRDIPAAQFVLRVAAREEEFEYFDDIAAFVVSILQQFAPTAQQELKYLSGQKLPRLGRQNLKLQVNETLATLQNAARASTSINFERSATVQDLRRSQFVLRPQRLRLNGMFLNAEGRALATLRKNYPRRSSLIPGILRSPASDEEIVASFNGPATSTVLADLASLADSIVSDIDSVFTGRPTTTLGRYLALIAVFLSYRSENVRRLDGALGFAQTNQYRFYCPAIVDYDMWLGATIDKSEDLGQQAAAMERVSRTTDPNVLVAGYMAFDPLRAVIAKIDHGPADQSVLGVVKAAVERYGFIGAKVYPPMGFKPWNNKIKTDDHAYPDTVRDVLRAHGVNLDTYDLGAALDGALDELYQYCMANDVPILAHCGNSQTAFEGAGVRASPVFWEQLLERPGYQGLRVNLGHFGGLWCAGEDISANSDESARCRLSMDESAPPWQSAGPNAWPSKIMSLISATNDGINPLYPYLACDVSDVSGIDDYTTAQKITGLLKRYPADDNGIAHGKILYGTDWMFLIRADGYQNFASNSIGFANTMGIDQTDLFWRNAQRFLGLYSSGKSAARLRAFYNDDHRRLDVLNQFVTTP